MNHAADISQIAFIGNTSEGLNRVTSGLDRHPDDEIILNSIEFPSNVYPYQKLEPQGVRCIFVDAADGIQAAGVTPVDAQRWLADAFATGGLKWLMAPMGIGFFLYLSDRLCERLKTPDPGWLSVEEPWELLRYDQHLRTDESRFEGGVSNIPGIYGLNASIGLLLAPGIDQIHSHVIYCNRILREELRHAGLGKMGITSM